MSFLCKFHDSMIESSPLTIFVNVNPPLCISFINTPGYNHIYSQSSFDKNTWEIIALK